MSLTPAGEFLQAEAARILAGVDDAERGVRRIAAGRSGLLRLGLTGTAAFSHLPRIARIVQSANFPAWRWRSRRTCSRLEQCEQLRTGALDLGVLRPPAVGDDIELRSIDVEPLVLAVSVDHRLAVEPVVSLTDLRSEPFVAYASRDSAVNDAVLRSCRRAGFVPHREHAAPGTAVLLALVAAGLGVAVVPASVRALPLARRGLPRSDRRRNHRTRPGLARGGDNPVVDAVVNVLSSAFGLAFRPLLMEELL